MVRKNDILSSEKGAGVRSELTFSEDEASFAAEILAFLLEANAPWLCRRDAHKARIGGGRFYTSKKAWFSSPNAPWALPWGSDELAFLRPNHRFLSWWSAGHQLRKRYV